MARITAFPLAGALALLVVAAAGCGHSTASLRPWPPIIDPAVFEDGFGSTAHFEAFGNSKLDAVAVDSTDKHGGRASLKIAVPNPGDTSGGYAGGAVVASQARDLSGNDALTFWARTSRPVTFDVVGIGNDNTGTSKFDARITNLAFTTTWKRYVIPIPNPAKLSAERGLLYFASGPKNGVGFDCYMDDIRFEKLGSLTNPRPALTTQTVNAVVGASIPVTGTKYTVAVDGVDVTVEHAAAYFTFASSDSQVATVRDGTIRVLGAGTARITAKSDTTAVNGTITVVATAPPSVAAPTPTLPSGNVVSLFSNAYTNVSVDTWSASWDQGDVADVSIAGNDTKLYTNLVYAGIECTSHPVDASAMTHVHADVFAPSGTVFRIKLVDFGTDGTYGGGDDSEHELSFTASSSPALNIGQWSSLDVPLTAFAGVTARGHIAQIIISGDTRTVYVDNLYFHK